MSDTSQGPGWWEAENGKWYPAEARPDYSPLKYGADHQMYPRWWMASDGRWYPPKLHPPRGRWSWWTGASPSTQFVMLAAMAGVLIYALLTSL